MNLLYAPSSISPSYIQCALLAIIESVSFVYTLQRSGCYRIEQNQKLISALTPIVFGIFCAWPLGTIYFYAFWADRWSPTLLWYWHVPQAFGLAMWRQAVRLILHRLDGLKLLRRRAIVIGANSISETFLSKLQSETFRVQYSVIGIFSDPDDERTEGSLCGVPILGQIDKAGAFASQNQVDLVILAVPVERALASAEKIEHLKWMTADVVIPMNQIQILPNFARLTTIGDTLTLQVLNRPLIGSQALLKLIEDYMLATICSILLSPVLLLAAIAIWLNSKGPIIFRQQRTGLNNETFSIYKFRTMSVDPTDDGSLGTLSASNPRITRVGRFLRRWSIDELPQLLNVFRGEMSIVGPRPYVPNMLVGSETLRKAVPNYAFRYRVMPGITGLAQVSGMRSNALRSLENSRRSIELDLEYVTNWSIWLDFQIIIRTVLTAMSGPHVF